MRKSYSTYVPVAGVKRLLGIALGQIHIAPKCFRTLPGRWYSRDNIKFCHIFERRTILCTSIRKFSNFI